MSEPAPDTSSSDEGTQERVARNDAIFREANEGIGSFAAGTDVGSLGVPFICECADTGCRDLVRMPLTEYEHIRSNPRWFLTVPGHEEGPQYGAVVVERHDTYVVTEKIARAGEIAEALDPRKE